MPTKVNSAGEQQEYDANTGRYGKTSSSKRDYDSEISSLKEKAHGLSLFSPERRELNKQIEQLEAEKEGFSSYEELKEHRIKQSEEKDKQIQLLRQKQQQEEADRGYMMSHRPTQSGITADNLINQDVETPMPENFYEILNKDNDVATKETMQQLNKARNNPDAEITIYRATIGDKINDGDWITLSPTYAKTHNEHNLDNKGKIISMKVKASDIQFAGDDIKEWGYFPNRFINGFKKGLNSK